MIWIVLISIFILIVFFYSNYITSFREGAEDTIKESTRELIYSALQLRFDPKYNPTGVHDAELKTKITIDDGSESYKTCIALEPTPCLDCFDALLGISRDHLEKELYVHYTFEPTTMKEKKDTNGNAITVFENKAKSLGSKNIDPAIYDAVVHQGRHKPQDKSTLINTDKPVVNNASLFINGDKRPNSEYIGSETDYLNKYGYSADNAAYLTIPQIPNFYDEHSKLLGVGISLWFQASPDNGNWTRLFDFGMNRDTHLIGISPSSGGSKNLALWSVNGYWENGTYIEWFDYGQGTYLNVCDNVWRHLVFTTSTNGIVSIYINNRLISKINGKPGISDRNSGRNYIGKSNWNSEPTTSSPWGGPHYNDDMFNGKIADFRVYRRPLDESDINALYIMGDPNILNKPFTTNFFALNNTLADTGTNPSSSGGTLSMSGTVNFKTFNSRSCAFFQSNVNYPRNLNNFLYFPFKNPGNVSANNFSFGFWMYSIESNYLTIASICDNNHTNPSWQCDLTGNNIYAFIETPNHWQTQLRYNYNHLNKWTHVAFTFNSQNLSKMYVNGRMINSGQGSNALGKGTNRIAIGRSGDWGRGYNGYIHGFFFANKVLTPVEIENMMVISENSSSTC